MTGNHNHKHPIVLSLLLVLGTLLMRPSIIGASAALPNEPSPNTQNNSPAADPWYQKIEAEWGGRLRLLGSISDYDADTLYGTIQDEPYYDGVGDFRLTNDTYFNPRTYFTLHYELIYSVGDTQQVQNKLRELLPGTLPDDAILVSSPVSDQRRLMDMTHVISRGDNYIVYHRLDRLSLTHETDWGLIRIGRQAVTWGNGFLFNPLDLFNPFAPTQIDRDYKIGDDMLFTMVNAGQTGDVQALLVPRRSPESGDVEADKSALAGKFHFASGTTEFDVLAADNYGDPVAGFGSRGYLGDAAWRLDATYTFLREENTTRDGYLSLVANVDYSWAWWQKNFYGFIEFYFNGLGKDNYSAAISDPILVERILRGEIFVLGRTYLSGSIRTELHPLFNLFVTSISNVADPSGILQLYTIWDVTQSVQVTFGGNLPWGGDQTEYGGFTIPGTSFQTRPPRTVFAWLSFYF
jgi:hypothetical protein